ncbi:MAG: hypothetical protein C4342_07060, partial [Armatimonadota bacterium]
EPSRWRVGGVALWQASALTGRKFRFANLLAQRSLVVLPPARPPALAVPIAVAAVPSSSALAAAAVILFVSRA